MRVYKQPYHPRTNHIAELGEPQPIVGAVIHFQSDITEEQAEFALRKIRDTIDSVQLGTFDAAIGSIVWYVP